MRQLKQKTTVVVGVIGSDGTMRHFGSRMTVAEIAGVHEFGTRSAGRNHNITIPRRSWLRDYVDENKAKIGTRLRKTAIRAIDTGKTIKKVMETFGVVTVGEIQERIAKGIPPANAMSTVMHKTRGKGGATTPLINTGQFRSAISYLVEGGR
jgi:hypothetical protein